MTKINAALRQQLPVGDGEDVATQTNLWLGSDAEWVVMVQDIEDRIASGEKKYGTRLKTHNKRNVNLDLYQELLDALNYSAQAWMETHEHGYRTIFNEVARLAIRVKRKLQLQELQEKVRETIQRNTAVDISPDAEAVEGTPEVPARFERP